MVPRVVSVNMQISSFAYVNTISHGSNVLKSRICTLTQLWSYEPTSWHIIQFIRWKLNSKEFRQFRVIVIKSLQWTLLRLLFWHMNLCLNRLYWFTYILKVFEETDDILSSLYASHIIQNCVISKHISDPIIPNCMSRKCD